MGGRGPTGWRRVIGASAVSPVSFPLVTDETRETESPRPTALPAAPHRPSGAINQGPIEYKGQPLDAERGPGLGCFRIQLVVLVILILATPLSVGRVPDVVSALMLFATIALLLVSGQTIIFLLRLVAADRRGRRQPLAARTPTVGQLEDAPAPAGEAAAALEPAGAKAAAPTVQTAPVADAPEVDAAADGGPVEPGSPPSGPVRQ